MIPIQGGDFTLYAVRWAKMAAIYFVVGSCLGMYMSIIEKFNLAALHAHLNLLGWASMALFAVLFKVFPQLEQSKLAPWHFWLHQIFFPIFMVALFLILSDNPNGVKIIPFGASPTLISIFVFAVMVFLNLKAPAQAEGSARQSA